MNVRLALNILLAVGVVASIVGGAALLFRDSGSADGVTITLDEPESGIATYATAAPTTIKVYISGEARQPGVYELPTDARLDDALQAAGGPTSDAALELVNLAKRLSDEDHIHISGQPEGSAGIAQTADGLSPSVRGVGGRNDTGRFGQTEYQHGDGGGADFAAEHRAEQGGGNRGLQRARGAVRQR